MCPVQAIDFSMKPETKSFKVGSIIVAVGYDEYDPTEIEAYTKVAMFSYDNFRGDRLVITNPTEHKYIIPNITDIIRQYPGYCGSIMVTKAVPIISHFEKRSVSHIKPRVTIQYISDTCVLNNKYAIVEHFGESENKNDYMSVIFMIIVLISIGFYYSKYK